MRSNGCSLRLHAILRRIRRLNSTARLFLRIDEDANAVTTNCVGLDLARRLPSFGPGGAGLSPLTAPLGADIGVAIGVMKNRKMI